MPIKTDGFCSPLRVGLHSKTGTCLTVEELRSVAALYNKKHPQDAIQREAFKDHKQLVKELDKRFKSKGCDKGADHCWIKQDEVKELYHALQENYRPPTPFEWLKKARTWLNTFDILNVMKQYQTNGFKFLGVFPVDFNQKKNDTCVVRDMCSFNAIELLNNGIKHFGVVFNLDRHDQPGSHWVATYCNMDPSSKKYGICYYDSGGSKPPNYIKEFMKDVKDQVSAHHKTDKFLARFNNTRHQFKNTECGIFSMLFLILCIENLNETYRITRHKIPKHKKDSLVHQFRKKLYRPV